MTVTYMENAMQDDLRLRPANIAMDGSGTEWGRTFQVATTAPLLDVLDTAKCIEPFELVMNRFQAGDTIELVRVVLPHANAEPLEYIRLMVAEVDPFGQRPRHLSYARLTGILIFAEEPAGVCVRRLHRGGVWGLWQDGKRLGHYNIRAEAVAAANALRVGKKRDKAAPVEAAPSFTIGRKCEPTDLTESLQMPWVRHFEVRTLEPIADILADPAYFKSTALTYGSLLCIVRYASDAHDRIVEMVNDVMVVEGLDGQLELRLTHEIMRASGEPEIGIHIHEENGEFIVRQDGRTISRRRDRHIAENDIRDMQERSLRRSVA